MATPEELFDDLHISIFREPDQHMEAMGFTYKLFQESLKANFPSLIPEDREHVIDGFYGGTLLGDHQTRTEQRTVLARRGNPILPRASLGVANVVSGSWLARQYKRHKPERTWAELNVLALDEEFRELDPESDEINPVDVMILHALKNVKREQPVSVWPYSRRTEGGNLESESWLIARTRRWGMYLMRGDEKEIVVPGTENRVRFIQSRYTAHAETDDALQFGAGVVRAHISMLHGFDQPYVRRLLPR